MNDKKIKVLIVEDSIVAQKLLKILVLSDERFLLVAVAENGKQAIEYVRKFSPDVISMDIQMPVMDGIEATRYIMQNNPVPIVIVSGFYHETEVDMAMKVLEAGAVTIIARPDGPSYPKSIQSAQKYLNTLRIMSQIKVVRRKKQNVTIPAPAKAFLTNTDLTKPIQNQKYQVLAIGASAGGPPALSTILAGLPADFALPVLVVQHIDSIFAEGFASWLNSFSKLPVSLAVDKEKILPGHVYIPPGDFHLTVEDGKIQLYKDPTTKGLCPSVDVLFKSVCKNYGKNAIAVILSGMGKDGAAELKNLFDSGAFTIAQTENSCLVFGMPGEAVKLGAAFKVLSPENITSEIINLTKSL